MKLHGPRMALPRKGPVRRPKLPPGPSTVKFEAPRSVKTVQAKTTQEAAFVFFVAEVVVGVLEEERVLFLTPSAAEITDSILSSKNIGY